MASAEIGNKPPQAPEMEEAVVGAMMLDADSVYLAMESPRNIQPNISDSQ